MCDIILKFNTIYDILIDSLFHVNRKLLYPFPWLKSKRSDFRWIFLSNSSEGGPIGIFKCGSRKEKYLGSVTI
jgi:hypothetical protein